MAFELRRGESVRRGLRRLARRELGSAAETLRDGNTSSEEAVHDARRHLKKARAVLALVQAAGGRGLKNDRRRLRDIAHVLSTYRDADAKVRIFDLLCRRNPSLRGEPGIKILRARLVDARKDLQREAASRKSWRKVRKALQKTRRSAGGWHPRRGRFRALADGLAQVRAAGRKAMARARASRDPAEFHEWRKLAKAHWYELRLLGACDSTIRKEVRTLHHLQRWLGDDHDLVMLCRDLFPALSAIAIDACRDLAELRRAADRYQRMLRRQALSAGRALYATTNRQYLKRVRRAWQSWRSA